MLISQILFKGNEGKTAVNPTSNFVSNEITIFLQSATVKQMSPIPSIMVHTCNINRSSPILC